MSDNSVIKVRNLRKTFPGGVQAVRGVSFSVTRGEFFGFLGPNGAGKTTTINLLVNLMKRTAGEVRIVGLDPAKDPQAVYRKVGFAMQEIGLDELSSPRELLELHARLYHLPKDEIEPRIASLLKLVEITGVKDRFLGTFSGGMRRRTDLAIALIHRPEVLFLDEPTTGLDPHARQLIWGHLRGLNREGMTVFLTTHAMEEAEALCSRVAIMDQGKIVAVGSPRELIRRYRVKNLEAVFLKVTGHSFGEAEINDKAIDPYLRMRRG